MWGECLEEVHEDELKPEGNIIRPHLSQASDPSNLPRTHTHTHTHTHTQSYIYIYIYIILYIYIYNIYIYIYIYILLSDSLQVYLFEIYMYVYISFYIYICIHMYICLCLEEILKVEIWVKNLIFPTFYIFLAYCQIHYKSIFPPYKYIYIIYILYIYIYIYIYICMYKWRQTNRQTDRSFVFLLVFYIEL